MRRFLTVTAAGEVRLVFTDAWDGQHEWTEFRVVGVNGPMLAWEVAVDVDMVVVSHLPSGGYYVSGPHGHRLTFQIEPQATYHRRVACPKAARPRARCGMCADDTAPLRPIF